MFFFIYALHPKYISFPSFWRPLTSFQTIIIYWDPGIKAINSYLNYCQIIQIPNLRGGRDGGDGGVGGEPGGGLKPGGNRPPMIRRMKSNIPAGGAGPPSGGCGNASTWLKATRRAANRTNTKRNFIFSKFSGIYNKLFQLAKKFWEGNKY
jgi:hypothetical protein